MKKFKAALAKYFPSLKRALGNCKLYLIELYMRYYGKVHGIKNNKIIFKSFNGKFYSDSPRNISEYLHQLKPNAEIVWCLSSEKGHDIPDYVRVVKKGGTDELKEFATSKVWVSNFELHRPIYKSKNQYYIQTWHGDRGFKKICYDIYDDKSFSMVEKDIADLCIAGSYYGANTYKRAFRYNGEILNVGMPRNDALVIENSSRVNELRQKLGLDSNTKVLLYAPTFRDTKRSSQEILIDVSRCLDTLEKNGDKWVCFIRAHSAIRGGILMPEASDSGRIIDMTHYEDMADLLLVTDVLISDYSSCACDFILTGKPAILAIFDYEYYKNYCRELCVDISKTGFIYSQSQEELENILSNINSYDWQAIDYEILKFYKSTESGLSTQKTVEKIINFMDNI